MEVVANNYLPGDQRLVDKIVYELKSQGIFDQFRKECFADVDTKPAYQNLRQRVEGSVSSFLKDQRWKPDMNKNQVREMLRKTINESGFLETGVERIVDQVVNPKINTIFLPKVEEVVYSYLGIKKPNRGEAPKTEQIDLLPNDLEAVSPESEPIDKKDDKSSDNIQDLDGSKTEEDESPPFEPLDEQAYVPQEENSVDSHLSGFSGLVSHESDQSNENKVTPMEQDSQMSRNSSDSRLSIVTSDENSKIDICEDSSKSIKSDSNSKQDDKNDKIDKTVDKTKHKSSDKHKSRSESKSDKDKVRRSSKDSKSRHSSSSKDKDKSRDRKDSRSESKSSSSGSKTEKPKERNDKDRNKSSSSSRHGSSSSSTKDKNGKKESSSKSEKDKEKDNKEKDKEKDNKEKEKEKDNKEKDNKEKDKEKDNKEKEKSDKDKSRSSGSHSKSKEKSSDSKSKEKSSSSDKHKYSSHSDKHKKDKDKKKDSKSKDDHYSSKDKKNDRRSTDRDSNDGQSSKQGFIKTATETQSSQSQKTTQESHQGSGDSGNSDQGETTTKAPVDITEAVGNAEITIKSPETQRVKVLKPKCASNIQEALRLIKIRRQLAKLEKRNQLSLASVEVSTPLLLSSSIDLKDLKSNGLKKSKNKKDGKKEKPKKETGKKEEKESVKEEEMSEKGKEDVNSPLANKIITQDSWDAMEAKLREAVSSEFKEDNEESFDDSVEDKTKSTNEDLMKDDDIEDCKYFDSVDSTKNEFLIFVKEYIKNAQKRKKTPVLKQNKKRKIEDTDLKNNNNKKMKMAPIKKKKATKKNNNTTVVSSTDKFPLPLSPAESDKSIEPKVETPVAPLRPKRNNLLSSQRYSSDDLYKPRPTFASSRRRGAKLAEN